jgi:hypothetical protein
LVKELFFEVSKGMFFFLFLRGYDQNDTANINCFKMVDRDKHDGMDQQDRDEIFSKVIRAGKRTYFFDVKATRSEDYYLTITESKKVFDNEGNSHYEKHKIFLYKEDFDKFAQGFEEAIGFIAAILSGVSIADNDANSSQSTYDNVEFEEMGESK